MAASELVSLLAKGLDTVDVPRVTKLVEQFGLYGAARVMGYDVSHYNNLLMSGRLAIQDLKARSPATLLEYSEQMKALLNKATYDFIQTYHVQLQAAIDRNAELDYDHDWFSANTMITMYSAIPAYEKPGIETPQYTWMRIAIQFYHDSPNALEDVIRAYNEMAVGWYTPASPTIFNAGKRDPQMASCFLLTIADDLESILKTGIYRGGMISKASGGLGFDISRIRHSEIRETGWSNGIVPMLQLYNYMVRYVDQGGRRKGAATIFLRPHHIDVEDFIELPRKVGSQYARAHDLNICLWTSWIFWERVQNDGPWTLFCPARVPELNDLHGAEFTKAYLAAEANPNIASRHKRVIKARVLYEKILDVQRETGMPYLMNGDAANLKSNHRHLGYIRSSNLCLEIVEFTDDETIAVCNLHSLSLRMYASGPVHVEPKSSVATTQSSLQQTVDFRQLAHISRRVIENLNKVIDHNWYPLDKVKNGAVKPNIINRSNKKHRPIGMGASGFAEMLHILDLPFEDPAVEVLNKMVFACMYWNALAQSVQLAIREGSYESFHGSPISHGKFQFDLWKEEFQLLGPNNVRKAEDDEPLDPSAWGQESLTLYTKAGDAVQDTIRPTWDDLRRCIMKYGLRNSLVIALMPTASTAQIRRNCESVEAHQNNMYSRKVLKCSYPVLNRYLVADLEAQGVWNDAAVEYIRVKNGSVQGLTKYIVTNSQLFPKFSGNATRLEFIERKYKTMWEIPQKVFMKLAAGRGRYVDQSASTNVYMRDCTDEKLRACHIYANMLGLKTIMYYLRQTGGETIKFTADPTVMQHIKGLTIEKVEEDKKEDLPEKRSKIVSTHIMDIEVTDDEDDDKVEAKDAQEDKPSIDLQGTFSDNPKGGKRKVVCTDEICTSCT
jgi:ribonucleoside-diphosphate reductase alpha subunit